jgi:hypothetical protein
MKEEEKYPPPVYPKPNPEYDAWRKARFLEQIKNTRWDACDPNEYQGKPRGRKAKFIERPKAKPRPSEKYNWFN